MEHQSRDEIEVYAAAVHGVLGLCYLLTLPYHIKRKNLIHTAVHSALLIYHFKSARGHLIQ